jgi:hypothetical protein
LPNPDLPKDAPNSTSFAYAPASRRLPSAPVTYPSGMTSFCPLQVGSPAGAGGTTPPVRTMFCAVQLTVGGFSRPATSCQVTHCRFVGAKSPRAYLRSKARLRHHTSE